MAYPSIPSEEAIARLREQNHAPTKGYTWNVAGDEVTVTVPLPAGVGKREVEVACALQSLRIVIKGQEVCKGTLFQEVQADEMTYTLDSGQLVVLLTMKQKMTWLELFR